LADFRATELYWNFLQAARKTAWNPAGVDPVDQKPADINPSPLKGVLMRNALKFGANDTNQTKGCIRGRKLASKKLFERLGPETFGRPSPY